MNNKVMIPNYGEVSPEEVANMNPVDIAELQVFMDTTDLGNAVHLTKLLTAKPFNMTNVYYAPIALGRVNMLKIPISLKEPVEYLSNMTVQDMLSKCTRWDAYPIETTNADINRKRDELNRTCKLHS